MSNKIITHDDLKKVVELGRTMVGERMREYAKAHHNVYPDCDQEQAFIDGIFLGWRIMADAMQQMDE